MQEILEIANIIRKSGGNLYLVGGAIRNKMLGMDIEDEDYCVTGLTKEEFQKIFPNAKIQGKSFPVFILNGREFALARTEKKKGKGHKDFEIHTSPKLTIEEDLKRRDITINSIAQEVLTGKIIDPYKGIKDLKNKVIRKTSDSFSEDPLRVYRVARFASKLEFSVDEETIKAMNRVKEELITLSKERIFEEFRKSLCSNRPSIFFNILKKANILEVHFKEFENDRYTSSMVAVDNSTRLTNNPMIRFSCLVQNLEGGNESVVKLGNRIGIPQNWIKCGKVACKWHRKAEIFEKISAEKQVELIEKVDKSILGLEGLKIVVVTGKTTNEEELMKNFSKMGFAEIGKKCIKEIIGENIKKQFPKLQGKQIGEELHKSRIKWIKSIDT